MLKNNENLKLEEPFLKKARKNFTVANVMFTISENDELKKTLEAKHIQKLTKAYTLSEDLINKFIQTKTRRETAQNDATPSISRENAVSALEDAEEFITKIEEVLAKRHI